MVILLLASNYFHMWHLCSESIVQYTGFYQIDVIGHSYSSVSGRASYGRRRRLIASMCCTMRYKLQLYSGKDKNSSTKRDEESTSSAALRMTDLTVPTRGAHRLLLRTTATSDRPSSTPPSGRIARFIVVHLFLFCLSTLALSENRTCGRRLRDADVALYGVRTTNTHVFHVLQVLLQSTCDASLMVPDSARMYGEHAVLLSPRGQRLWTMQMPHQHTWLIASNASSFLAPLRHAPAYGPHPLATRHQVDTWQTNSNATVSATNSINKDGNLTSEENQLVEKSFYRNFHTLDALTAKWQALANAHADVITLSTIGNSTEQRSIPLIRIGRTDSAKPRRLFLNALQHGREWITPSAATYIAERLATGISADPQSNISRLLQGVEVLIMPMLNPDGYVHAMESERYWRKNRANTGDPQCPGVDLNRNWGIGFAGPYATSNDVCSEEYIGTGAFSEPETATVRRFVVNTKGIRAHLDIHSYGQFIIGPWVYSDREPQHAGTIDAVGQMLASDMAGRFGNPYDFSRGFINDLYPVSGSMSDWIFAQNIMSFTVEMRPKSMKIGFLLPQDQILAANLELFDGVSNLLRFVNSTNLRWKGEDLEDGADEDGDPSEQPPSTPSGSKFLVWAVVVGCVFGVIVIVILGVIVSFAYRRAFGRFL